MVDLKCKCVQCCHNSHCNCKADLIRIKHDTKCSTFEEADTKPTPEEYADEIFQPLIRQDVDVTCDANCLFNTRGKCVANGITVMHEHGKINCSTFLPR